LETILNEVTGNAKRTVPSHIPFHTAIGRVVLALSIWTAIGCIFAVPALIGAADWRAPLIQSLSQWWAWGLVTPLIIAVDRRLPFSGKQLGRRFLVHILTSILFTTAFIYLYAALAGLFVAGSWRILKDTRLLATAHGAMFLWSWLVYWLILGAWQVYQYHQRYVYSELRMERLERSLSDARLNALRVQLDPHFLFNALNAISSQVERDPKLARGMIGHLGDLLRLSLESKDCHEVPLVEELAFLDHYLAIQKIRFGDSLKVEIHIAPEVKYALVPSLLVQPLVENAIRHGISQRGSGGTVVVTARPDSGRLDIRVLDDGVGLPPGWQLDTSSGLGLSLTRERIAGLHPNGQSRFSVSRREAGGTQAEISLPLNFSGGSGHGRGAA
jgi:two-component system LytT family sensor kinase